MSNFSLQDKTVIVTGGAGGLGRPMCATFAAAGANVIVASRSRDKIEAEAAALREQAAGPGLQHLSRAQGPSPQPQSLRPQRPAVPPPGS